jgi:para-nitrobenzyl esterase
MQRRVWFLLLFLIIGFGTFNMALAQDDPSIVQTQYGAVQGSLQNRIFAYKGIPYAAPPIGDLRWRAPQPPDLWTDVRETTAFVHDCMQEVTDFEPITTTPSEDCLYLNVWRPDYADAGDNLAVMVWIHGGGFVGGGTSIPFYDGTRFAEQGLIVVSFNYRLGRLGFFAHPALLNAAEDDLVANYGYMDQVFALNWVQNNIEAFGGDPTRVTIVGESAGGASVLALMTSPLAEGLFSQAMVMSGGGRQPLVARSLTGGTEVAQSADMVDAAFAAGLGIEGDDSAALAALRAIPAEELADGLELGMVLEEGLRCHVIELTDPANHNPECRAGYSGTQIIDGTLIPDTTEALISTGAVANVPIIIGTTASDLFEQFPPVLTDPYSYFGDDARAAESHYRLPFLARAALVLRGQGELREYIPLLSIGADMTMHEPARFVAREITALGSPAWLYRFTYTAESTRPDSTSQSHAGELPFLFDMLSARYPVVSDNDTRTAQAFNTYVSNFVKTGNPNGSGLPVWSSFDGQFTLMNFSLEEGPVYGTDPRVDGIMLVERAADALIGQ